MKKVILILALISLSLSFTDCKKSNKTSQSPATKVMCMWLTNGSSRTFYKCMDITTSSTAYQNECISLRDAGKFHDDVQKATCSECQ